MKHKSIRVVAAANLALGCLLLQGCGMFGKKTDGEVTTIPEQEPVAVVPVEQIEPVTQVEVVPTMPVPTPSIQSTTPYTIQKGDTISAVAFKYNLRWQDVLAINPGITPTRLRIGQVIQLPGVIDVSQPRSVPVATPKVSAPKVSAPAAAPAAGTTTYVVKSGDTLSEIAQKHGIKTAALRAANSGIKGDKILVGQKLKIPGAQKTPASAARKVSAPKTVAPKATAAAEAKQAASAPAVAVAPPPAPPKAAVESEPVKVETAPPPAPAAAPAAADANVQTYTVKEGEDLYAVAIRWGVSPTDLKTLNNLSSTELKAGTVLKIPGGVQ